jgi:hypothetical protein
MAGAVCALEYPIRIGPDVERTGRLGLMASDTAMQVAPQANGARSGVSIGSAVAGVDPATEAMISKVVTNIVKNLHLPDMKTSSYLTWFVQA